MPHSARLGLLAAALVVSACGTPRMSVPPSGEYSEVVVTGDARASRAQAPDDDRRLVRTATLTVEVDDEDRVAPTLDAARDLADALDGYVAQEGPSRMVLRIPDARLDQALDQLAALGDPEDRAVYTRDVTAAYTDLELRLQNARALQARLRDLLADAETVQDVLAVETELARVTTEVERMEGQLRLLQNQVAFSTITLTVRDGVRPGPLGWVVVGAYEAIKWLFVWD